jgi:cytochrome oxidase assembly protein ShyY1
MIFRLLFSRRWWLTTVLVLAGMGLTIRLGIWQVDRYHQNKAISDHLAAMQTAAPILLRGGNQPDGLVGMEYRAVRAEGTYDFAHQIAVRNQVWVQSWGNEMGFGLLTPLVFPDGSAVLVERGWFPGQFPSAGSFVCRLCQRWEARATRPWRPDKRLWIFGI